MYCLCTNYYSITLVKHSTCCSKIKTNKANCIILFLKVTSVPCTIINLGDRACSIFFIYFHFRTMWVKFQDLQDLQYSTINTTIYYNILNMYLSNLDKIQWKKKFLSLRTKVFCELNFLVNLFSSVNCKQG